jgi:putative membrane protein
MKKIIVTVAVNMISLWIVDALMQSVYFADFGAFALTAVLLAILNVTLKPFLKIVSLPITFLTFGLFSLVINGLILYLAISLSSGSYVSSFGMAIVAGLLLSIVNSCVEMLME